MDCSISGVDTYGFYVRFDEPFVDALVPLDRLDDYYELDELGIRLIGLRGGQIYSLGDRMTVRLEDVDLAKRDLIALPIDAELASDEERDARSRGRGRPAPGKRGRSSGKREGSSKHGGGKRGSGKKRDGKRDGGKRDGGQRDGGQRDGGKRKSDSDKRDSDESTPRRTRPSKEAATKGGESTPRRRRRKK